MIEIPENFSKMTWFQLLVVCLKIIIYFDTADIEELNNQVGGGPGDNKDESSAASSSSSNNSKKSEGGSNSSDSNNSKKSEGGSNNANSNSKNGEGGSNNANSNAKNGEGGSNSDGSSNSSKNGEGGSNNSDGEGDSALDKAMNKDLSDDKDLQNQRPGLLNNNTIVFILKKIMTLVRKVMKTAMTIISKLTAKFIFAATFPAFPFFLIMGSMYSFVKYGAFKIREM